jgi:hypothetical protein
MLENVFFKDGDSHVSTGSGCGCVLCRLSDGVLVRVISAYAVREQNFRSGQLNWFYCRSHEWQET